MHRLITPAGLAVVVGLALVPVRVADAQEVATASYERGPRFLLAMATKVVPVDVSKTPVLARRLNLELEGATLKQALAEITAQSGLELAYSDDAVPLEKRVHLRAEAITAAAALTDVLFDAGVDVVFKADGSAALVRRSAAVPVQVGAISGQVTDKDGRGPLVGAALTVEGTRHATTTGQDGRYRIANVPARTYMVRVRYIGFTPGSASVTVSADQEVTADFMLEKSAQRLDEVVTTGTVLPTEVKALPTPISVISGEELQERGFTRVDQIFRGAVPSGVAFEQSNNDWNSQITLRGTSSLVQANKVKTYIDRVEVSDPFFIATIDPNSIERIEVTRGPQASTIYGSDASGGVVQIFTKKGRPGLDRPQIDSKVAFGSIQASDGASASLHQDHSLAVQGGTPQSSYSLGGSYLSSGDWMPEYYSRQPSLHGGARLTHGRLTAELSARYASKTWSEPWILALRDAGYQTYSTPPYLERNMEQETYGANFSFQATPSWHQNLVLGFDRSLFSYANTQPRRRTPDDTLMVSYWGDENKLTVGYNTTLSVPLRPSISSTVTLGVDHTKYTFRSAYASGLTQTTGDLQGQFTFLSQVRTPNTGYFGQAQVAFRDALFLTAGLRAERNANFGADFGAAWSPRVGLSYVHEIGPTVLKFRVSYGEATRPPALYQKQASVTPFERQLPALDLGPERQRGADGGVDVQLGDRASLGISYYDQTADDLIDFVIFDQLDEEGRRILQYQNTGQIRNRGWELEGRLRAGIISMSGTYSFTKSTVQKLSPTYGGELQVGDELLRVPKQSAGVTVTVTPIQRTSVSLSLTHVGNWIAYDQIALEGFYAGAEPYRGSARDYWITYPGFTKYTLAASRGITDAVSAFLRIENLGASLVYEGDNGNIPKGRVVVAGARLQY